MFLLDSYFQKYYQILDFRTELGRVLEMKQSPQNEILVCHFEGPDN